MSSVIKTERSMVVDTVRTLIAAAQSARAALPGTATERQFYLGVESAALGLLHPEVSHAHGEEWLARQPFEFKEGYLRTQALLSAAMTAEVWPRVLPMPEPPAV